MVYVRAIHFAATLLAAGVVFFIVFVAAPALRTAPDDTRVCAALWPKLAFIAWFNLVLALGSGAVWLILTAASMSGEAPADVFSGGVLWTVLSQTHFGVAWTARFIFACILAVTFVPLLSAKPNKSWINAAAVIAASAFAGALAWAGHAAGGQDVEAVVHPAADILHLLAAAAWVGALVPLVLLLTTVNKDEASVAIARAAVLRFSTLGIAAVGTLLVTGIVNSWYLVGSVGALTGTYYGQLLLAKLALFFAMVAIAAVNRERLAQRLMQGASMRATERGTFAAISQLRRNATVEALAGAAIICIVAVLGTKAPASHANHHPGYGALPADSAFVHIHTEQAMADVMIEPGRVGTAHATVHLWNEDFEPLAARNLKFSVAAPVAGSTPIPHTAVQDADGAWQIDGLELTQPGNWTVTVDADLSSGSRVELAAPIVIDPAP
jgi:putative copper resistance protein D